MKADFRKALRTEPITGIHHEAGFAYIARVGHPELSSHTSPSEARVLENGIPLPGPANALHDDIRRQGEGRYSFWKGAVYFSSSDNSAPLSNDRVYAIQFHPTLAGDILAIFPAVVQSLFINLRFRFSGFIQRISRAIIPPRVRQLAGRVNGRVWQIRLAEIPWDLFYWLCFIGVFLQSKVIGSLRPRRSIPQRIREWTQRLCPIPAPNGSLPVNYGMRVCTPSSLQHDVEYAAQIGQNFIRWFPEKHASLPGKTVLEIGPGINFGSTLLMACLGAQVSVADPYLAPWDPEYHPKFYTLLRDWLKENLPQADPAPLDRILKQGGYIPQSIRCYSTPLEQLAGIPDASVDIILSNAVLEHLADPLHAFRQMARVSKPGAIGLHQVDFRDHNDFSLPLEFLLLEDKAFSREFKAHHGERGNRYRPGEYAELLKKVSFRIQNFVLSCSTEEAYLNEFIPRLRDAHGSSYRNVSIEELHTLGGLFYVERNPDNVG